MKKKLETVSGWEFNFLESISEKIYKLNRDKLYLSDKQVHKLETIMFEGKNESENLVFCLKKINTQRHINSDKIKSEILERFKQKI